MNRHAATGTWVGILLGLEIRPVLREGFGELLGINDCCRSIGDRKIGVVRGAS